MSGKTKPKIILQLADDVLQERREKTITFAKPIEVSIYLDAGTQAQNAAEEGATSATLSGVALSEFDKTKSKIDLPPPVAEQPPVAPPSDSIEVPVEVSLANVALVETTPPIAATEAPVVEPKIEISTDVVPDLAPASISLDALTPAIEKPSEISLEPASQQVEAAAPLEKIEEKNIAPEPAQPVEQMPYLFGNNKNEFTSQNVTKELTEVLNGATKANALVSGTSQDSDTLKQYLSMREQDVALLNAQLSYAREENLKSNEVIKRQSDQIDELLHQVSTFKEKIQKQDVELQYAGKTREGELDGIKTELKQKIDRIRFLEERVKEAADQYEHLKERVRIDIRKIRVREKELESKLEILKRDSETLIAARENKILELKRKIDLLEFNYDALQDKTEFEKKKVEQANEKIERLQKILKLAVGVADSEESENESLKKDPNAA